MTLATRIIVRDPVPAEKLYTLLDGMVNPNGGPSIAERSVGSIHNLIGQGNRSMLNVDYAIDGPIDETPDYLAECARYVEKYGPDEAADPDPMRRYCAPAPYCVKVFLDTAYGFNEPEIGGCTDLHAILIHATKQFADAYGARIMWYNEFAGTWHHDLDGMDEFTANGLEANLWFNHTVKPLFESIGAVL